MSQVLESIRAEIQGKQRTWLVTGAAGFIGSHLIEYLLSADQRVVALDNFATGLRQNLEDVHKSVGDASWSNLRFVEGDIRDLETCRQVCQGCEIVLHQAALGSVPRSIEDPITTNAVNIDGFLNMLWAAQEAGIKRFVYASSSSVYGDEKTLPKVEDKLGQPLSPYAVSKLVNEHYAGVFGALYEMEMIGFRYFNVFGARQDPNGPYAAVIPRWMDAVVGGNAGMIFGDGTTSRDFCYVSNVVQINVLGGLTDNADALNKVYNVAVGSQTSLNELYELICSLVRERTGSEAELSPEYQDFRPGDVKHSLADVGVACELLGYTPEIDLRTGLAEYIEWFLARTA